MRLPLPSLVVVIALLSSARGFAGYYLEHEAVLPHPQTFQPIRATIRSWHEGRRFKRESPLRGEVVIIDLDKREVVGINDEQRTYWRISSERYRQLSMMSLLVMGVQPTPDGGVTVPDKLFAPTGQKGDVAGRKASEYKVQGTFPMGMSTSFWLSKEVPIPLEKLVEELRLALGDPKHPSYQKLFDQWRALPGYPVQSVTTVQTPQGTVTTSETLLVYRDEPIPAEVFEVPKGYALTTDPITQAEQMALRAASSPAGIGAPLGQRPGAGALKSAPPKPAKK